MRIAYVGPFLQAAGGPGLERALGISRALVDGGATVAIGSGDHFSSETYDDFLPGIVASPLGEIASPGDSRAAKLLRRARWGQRTSAWLDQLVPRPDVVIVYGGGAAFASRISRWSKHVGVSLLLDCVEWYDGAHQPMGRWGPIAIDNELAMRVTFPRFKNVICISSYLQTYFDRHGCHTIQIPPTTEVLDQRTYSVDRGADILRLAYAGDPGRKDLLDVIVAGIRMADPESNRCRLTLVGATMHDAGIDARRDPQRWITTTGRVSRRSAMELVANTHFTMLVRPLARYSAAGFPTKVVESMAVGTPVMGNLTSDLGEHIIDGDTGLTVDGPTPEAVAACVQRGLELSESHYATMRLNARRHAEDHFDWRNFRSTLIPFVERAASRRG